MKVSEVMHNRVTWVDPNTAIAEVAKKMRDEDVGAIPVGENDRLVGMITDRDIACRGVANGGDVKGMKARDVMTKGIVYCRDDEDLDDAVRIMEDKKIRRLPVINGKKRMVGMLSIGDISHAAPRDVTGEVVRAVSAHHA
jgi:CBS domain-containing protein